MTILDEYKKRLEENVFDHYRFDLVEANKTLNNQWSFEIKDRDDDEHYSVNLSTRIDDSIFIEVLHDASTLTFKNINNGTDRIVDYEGLDKAFHSLRLIIDGNLGSSEIEEISMSVSCVSYDGKVISSKQTPLFALMILNWVRGYASGDVFVDENVDQDKNDDGLNQTYLVGTITAAMHLAAKRSGVPMSMYRGYYEPIGLIGLVSSDVYPSGVIYRYYYKNHRMYLELLHSEGARFEEYNNEKAGSDIDFNEALELYSKPDDDCDMKVNKVSFDVTTDYEGVVDYLVSMLIGVFDRVSFIVGSPFNALSANAYKYLGKTDKSVEDETYRHFMMTVGHMATHKDDNLHKLIFPNGKVTIVSEDPDSAAIIFAPNDNHGKLDYMIYNQASLIDTSRKVIRMIRNNTNFEDLMSRLGSRKDCGVEVL